MASTSIDDPAANRAPPKKTDADIQGEAERARQELGLSSRGFASTIFTSGLGLIGAAGTPNIGGVTLSGR